MEVLANMTENISINRSKILLDINDNPKKVQQMSGKYLVALCDDLLIKKRRRMGGRPAMQPLTSHQSRYKIFEFLLKLFTLTAV